MSLDVYLTTLRPTEVFQANITHNLGKMADAAGIYQHLWRPEELGITEAGQLVDPLAAGLERLLSSPQEFELLNPENGWGTYNGLVKFVQEYLAACKENPESKINVWR